jgi:hypothetical protein
MMSEPPVFTIYIEGIRLPFWAIRLCDRLPIPITRWLLDRGWLDMRHRIEDPNSGQKGWTYQRPKLR